MAEPKRAESNGSIFQRRNGAANNDQGARQDAILDQVESQEQYTPPMQEKEGRIQRETPTRKGTQHTQHTQHSSVIRAGADAAADGLQNFWKRFTRDSGVGVGESLFKIAKSHWLNILLLVIPFSWAAHFAHWSNRAQFVLSFFAIIPLERLIEYGGDQMCFYVGIDFGDLIVVTLNNAVEATLAIILLTKCELRLLQSTIVGVVVLHLLLIPGTAFLTGGARIASQDLHPHVTELNHVLLTIGVLSLLLPSAFWSALDRGPGDVAGAPAAGIVSDETRTIFLQISRGIAIVLLLIYVASRIFLHNPPGENNAMQVHQDAPEALRKQDTDYRVGKPEINQYVCIGMLVAVIALMATTAEWLVESIEFVREQGINEEFFGLVLLPIVSWSADGAVSLFFFVKYLERLIFATDPPEPATLAKARAIDLSIQFSLFWMPFFVLLSWWTNRTLNLLFDMFEVAVLLGACFLVNYVTADAKTNWAEGFVMVSFYVMIALCAWFYTGQPEIHELLGDCGVLASEAVEGELLGHR